MMFFDIISVVIPVKAGDDVLSNSGQKSISACNQLGGVASYPLNDRYLMRDEGRPLDWESIWYAHWEEIYRYVAVRVRDRHIAEEITQETFIRALRSEDRSQGKLASVIAFLKVIARNLVVDHWRKDGRQRPFVALDDSIADGPG